MRERHSQLRKYVIDKLCQMDPTLPKPQERKRPQEVAKLCSVMRLEKKRKASTDGDTKQAFRQSQHRDITANSLCASSRVHPIGDSFHNAMTMLPTPAPSLPSNIDTSDVDFAADSTLSLSNGMVELSNRLPARKIAPMFRSVTITPSYRAEPHKSQRHPPPVNAVVNEDRSVVDPFGMIGSSSFSTAQLEPYLSDAVMGDHPVDLFCMDEMSGSSTVRKVAPMFRNVTITPSYDTGQELQFDDVPPYSMAHEATEFLDASSLEIMAGQVGNMEAGRTTQMQENLFY